MLRADNFVVCLEFRYCDVFTGRNAKRITPHANFECSTEAVVNFNRFSSCLLSHVRTGDKYSLHFAFESVAVVSGVEQRLDKFIHVKISPPSTRLEKRINDRLKIINTIYIFKRLSYNFTI